MHNVGEKKESLNASLANPHTAVVWGVAKGFFNGGVLLLYYLR